MSPPVIEGSQLRIGRSAVTASGARTDVLALFVTLLVVLLQTACGGMYQTGADGTGLLPGPPPGEVKFSKYQPENPYTQLAKGLLTRTVFEAASGAGYRVEVWDLLVGPRQTSSEVTLPGAAVFEVRSGIALITSAGKSLEVRAGSAFSLSEGASFAIENKAESPFSIRVHVFKAD